MEVPLPVCFPTLRKRVDSNDTDDGYHGVGVVLGWQDGSPNYIQNFEYHISLLWMLEVRQLFRGALDGVPLGCVEF